MLDWVENRLQAKGVKYWALVPSLQINHQNTASDYSSINSISNEGRTGKLNYKLWYKNHVLIWAKA